MLFHSYHELECEEELAPYEVINNNESPETKSLVLVNQTPIISVTTLQAQSKPVTVMQAPIISVTSTPVQVTASLPVTQREHTSPRLNITEQQVWSLKTSLAIVLHNLE